VLTPAPLTLARFDYAVNAIGDRTQATEQWRTAPGSALVEQSIVYGYDALSRLREATYYPNLTASGTPSREYAYDFDLAGNRTSETLDGVTRTFGYNAANQMISHGSQTLSYDRNGNLLNDGANAHVWDRGNRLKSMGGVSYGYDGDGNRVMRTSGGTATVYGLDVTGGMTQTLFEQTNADITRYVHGPRGAMAQHNPTGTWRWMLEDGLGSVRAMVNATGVQTAREFSPFGEPLATLSGTEYGFTGEQSDPNGLVYLRARYLNPALGIFASRDPYEGDGSAPLTWNGYGWVEGNVVNRVDPRGQASSAPNTCEVTGNFWEELNSSIANLLESTTNPTVRINERIEPTPTPGAPNTLSATDMVRPTPSGAYLDEYRARQLARINGPTVLDSLILGALYLARDTISGVSDLAKEALPVVGAIGIGATAVYGFSLLPLVAQIIVASAVGGAALDASDQINQLSTDPSNTGASFGELLGQMNFPRAALSGSYAAGIAGSAFLSGGATLLGTIASITSTNITASSTNPDTLEYLSNGFWGGLAWGVSGSVVAKMGIESLPFIARTAAGAMPFAAIGSVSTLLQASIDHTLANRKLEDNLLNSIFENGAINLLSGIRNPYVSVLTSIFANSILFN
jgi:RHS repeat-associated protein